MFTAQASEIHLPLRLNAAACAVDVATQSRPHWARAASSARGVVQDRRVAELAVSAPGRSENVGYSTGFPETSPVAKDSGVSGWENRSELSMWCP